MLFYIPSNSTETKSVSIARKKSKDSDTSDIIKIADSSLESSESTSSNVDLSIYSEYQKTNYVGITNRLGVVHNHSYYIEMDKYDGQHIVHIVCDITDNKPCDIIVPVSSVTSAEKLFVKVGDIDVK